MGEFRIIRNDTYPVHQPIKFLIAVYTLATKRRHPVKPASAYALFQTRIDETWKEEEEKKARQEGTLG